MARARLFYDGSCPICSNYVRMLQRKIDSAKIQFIASSPNASEFQFVSDTNQIYNGNKAIEELAKAFPEVLSYFWMLPDKYKVAGMQVAYKVGSLIRKVTKRKKGCGCKK